MNNVLFLLCCYIVTLLFFFVLEKPIKSRPAGFYYGQELCVCVWSTTSRQPTGNKNLMQQPPKQAPNGKLLSCVLGAGLLFSSVGNGVAAIGGGTGN